MTQRLRSGLLVLFVLLLVPVSAGAVLQPLVILHTNDLHARIAPEDGKGGCAAICSYMEKVKAEQPPVLILDAGDLITGTPVSTIFSGTPVFEIYNTMPYDAVVLGNHEFDHGWMHIENFLKIAKFPVLCANLRRPDGSMLTAEATREVKLGAITVGLIGITTTDLKRLTRQIGWEGLQMEPAAAAVQRCLPSLQQRTDIIVVLSHQGVDDDVTLAQAVPEIDVIVGGHSHTRLDQPRQVGDTLIVQAGSYGQWVGRLDLMIDPEAKKVVKYEGRLIPVVQEQMGSDPQTAEVVETWESRVREIVDVKIGENPKAKTQDELRSIIGEVFRAAYDTDFGYQNPGGVRAPLAAGPILKRDIWNILPFGNEMAIVTLESSQLGQLGQAAPQVDFKSTYTVATNSYAAEQIARQANLPPDRVRIEPKVDRDVVIEYVQAHGNLEMPELVPVGVEKPGAKDVERKY